MPYLRIKDNGYIHCVKLYENKNSLVGKKQNVLKIFQGGKTWYAQSLECDESGSIQQLETKYGISRVCSFLGKDKKLCYLYSAAADRKYSILETYYASAQANIAGYNFPKGGCILIYSGAGTSAAGAGGKGQIKRIDIPSCFEGNLFLDISFSSRASSGNSGGSTSNTYYKCVSSGYSQICRRYTSDSTGSAGGIGGQNVKVAFSCIAKKGTVTAFGGGGGGGAGGRTGGYKECSSNRYKGCTLSSYATSAGSAGAGGQAGNGANANGTTGGSAFNSLTDFSSSSSTQAKVIIGAYTE